MATQKQTEKQDDGGQQVALTRKSETQLAPAQQPPRRIGRASPVSTMRRMLDDLDLGTFGWRPSTIMRRMLDDLERLFDTDAPFEDAGARGIGEWAPRVEVRRRGDQLLICVDLPGVSSDQLELSAQDDALVIEGERARPTEEGELWQSERAYGRFRRVVALPDGVDLDQVNARFDNGVLEISVPLPESQVARRIPIGAAAQGEQPQAQAEAQAQAAPQQQPEQPTRPAKQPEVH